MTDAPPNDLEAEQAVLGTILLGPKTLDTLTGPDHALRPEHFYSNACGRLFNAMVGMRARGEAIDTITTKAECQRLGFEAGPLVELVSSSVPDLGNWPTYARSIKATARRRDVLKAADLLGTAALEDKGTLIPEALRLLESHESTSSAYTPERQAEDFFEGNLAPIICPWPWDGFNNLTGGGIRGSQTTFVSGWTNHGKSPFVDDILLQGHAKGLKAALYINEMGEGERSMRFAAQLTDVGFDRIVNDELTHAERAHVAAVLADKSIPIMNAGGWTADEVCRDIERSGWDLVGVDGLHMFDYDGTAELSRMAVAFASCAKKTGAHIVIAGHLNEKRAETGELPPPVLRDIRDSGHIKNVMDFVVFIHRAQTEDGFPLEQSRAWIAKGRNSKLGGAGPLRYDGAHMKFVAA